MIIRKTMQLKLILQTVKKMHSHVTASDVYSEIIKTNPGIGRATVYRDLNKLCDEGLLKKRNFPGDAERYDSVCTNHYHARCLGCGKIVDIETDYVYDISKLINNKTDFTVTGHDIVFEGYCSDCKNKTKKI